MKVTEEAFSLMKESKLKALNNETHDSPVKQCVQELNWILNAAGSTFDQRKEVLNGEDLTFGWSRLAMFGPLTIQFEQP